MSDIGARLTAARDRRGWNRETLAYHAGVSWSAIAQIETGRRTSPRPETLLALARGLGVTVGYLVGEDPTLTLVEHRAVLYRSEEAYLDTIVPFVREALMRSEPVLVVTPEPNLGRVRTELGDDAERVTFEVSDGWYRSPLTAMLAYRSFATDRLDEGASWIRVVGEPPWPTASERELGRWGAYESLINLTFASFPASVLCPYDVRDAEPAILDLVRQTHPSLAEGTRVHSSERYVDPEEFVLGER